MPDKFYLQAEKALDAGKPKEALALAEKVAGDSPDALEARALAVECLAELGRWADANARAAEVLREDPQWAVGHLVAGLAAIELGKVKEAAKSLERAVTLDGTLAEAALALAAICDFEGRFKDADRWTAAARKADPETPAPLRVSAEELDDVLLAAVEDVDDQTGATLDESRFRVVDMPSAEDLRNGTALTALYRIEELDPEGDPPSMAVVLFQRNLEREAGDRAGLEEAVNTAIVEALDILAAAAEKLDGEAKAKPAPKRRTR
jgi:tetratricopeptide (TPR) repeat protein